MVKPPRHFWRIRILEIDDDVFVPVEQPVLPRMLGLVGHAAQMELRVAVEFFAVEPVKKRGRSGTIKATIVKAQSNLGHKRSEPDPPTESTDTRSKAHKDVRVDAESQAETPDAQQALFSASFLVRWRQPRNHSSPCRSKASNSV